MSKKEVWSENPEWRQVIANMQGFTPQPPSRAMNRRYNLYYIARGVASLLGDTAECGVYRGSSSFLICSTTEKEKNSQDYYHHIFDSFEGLSKPIEQDRTDHGIIPLHQNEFAVSIETVQKNLEQFNFVRFYKGWIPEQFSKVTDRKFAFVHIDVDLYKPTLDSLQFFYDKMVPGGIILCDDYGAVDCPGARRAFDEFIKDKIERYVIVLTTGQGFIIRRYTGNRL